MRELIELFHSMAANMRLTTETHQGQKRDFPGKLAALAPPARKITILGEAAMGAKIDE
jgi:hypothetical protein